MIETYEFTRHIKEQNTWQKVIYTFTSVGTLGTIIKVVEFERINDENISLYNCAFGDFDESTLGILDDVLSNNGDSYKVLHTVAQIIFDFLSQNSKFMVYIFGTDDRRLSVYQRLIRLYWKHIKDEYVLYGGYHGFKEEIFKIINDTDIYDFYLLGQPQSIQKLKK